MAESYYVNKDALRTVIRAHTPRFTTPTHIEIANHLKGLMNVIDLMPTLTKNDIYHTAELVWWEDWEPASGEFPKELIGAGWKCSHCDEDMGEYITRHSGERCYFDRYEEKPTLAFCPCCGRKFN